MKSGQKSRLWKLPPVSLAIIANLPSQCKRIVKNLFTSFSSASLLDRSFPPVVDWKTSTAGGTLHLQANQSIQELDFHVGNSPAKNLSACENDPFGQSGYLRTAGPVGRQTSCLPHCRRRLSQGAGRASLPSGALPRWQPLLPAGLWRKRGAAAAVGKGRSSVSSGRTGKLAAVPLAAGRQSLNLLKVSAKKQVLCHSIAPAFSRHPISLTQSHRSFQADRLSRPRS